MRHPSIWTFIRKLKDEQSVREVNVQHMWNGGKPLLRRLKWRRLEERIVRLKEELNNGNRDILQFWLAIKHVVVEFNMA